MRTRAVLEGDEILGTPFRERPTAPDDPLAAATVAAPTGRAGDSRSPSSIRWEEGARAAADTWTQDDGCPARTGATETEPLLGPREVAWRFDVAGEVEGEPLAWRSTVVVVERAGGK